MIRSASPYIACPGQLQKPLDASIRQLLTLYHPSGRQGNNQQNNHAKYPLFAGHFDDHCNAPVRYRSHHPMKEVHDFTRSHWTLPLGKLLFRYYPVGHTYPCLFVVMFLIFKKRKIWLFEDKRKLLYSSIDAHSDCTIFLLTLRKISKIHQLWNSKCQMLLVMEKGFLHPT